MKRIHIFTPGKHTSSGGQTLDFSDDDLKASVEAYDPKLHEAPIVVGHPKDNAPAFGWVKSMEYSDRGMEVDADQVDESFAEMVRAGRFKKRSASFYAPDSPNNPKPGVYYLRHVGFLGAQPPAVKGLEDVQFAEDDKVVEFTDFASASIFRRLREFFIGKYGIEEADNVLPGFLIEDLEDSARHPTTEADDFSDEEHSMDIETLKQQLADEQTKNQKLSEKVDSFAEQLQTQQTQARRERIQTKVNAMVASGKLAAGMKDQMIAFMEGLPEGEEAKLEFGEGDQKETLSPSEFVEKLVASQPDPVQFGEDDDDDGEPGDFDPVKVGNQARRYIEQQRAKGLEVTYTEAMEHVRTASSE